MFNPKLIAPGVIHLILGGNDEAWILNDGSFESDALAMLAPTAEAAKVREIFAQRGLAAKLTLQVSVLLIRWKGQLVLLDTGCGTAYGPTLGFVVQRLQAIGIKPTDIDVVLLSHLHGDHIRGAVNVETKTIIYDRARLLAKKAEVDFWKQDQPDLSQTRVDPQVRQASLALVKSALVLLAPKLEYFEVGTDVLPGIQVLDLKGHTPEQVGFSIHAEAGTLVYAADAFLDPALHIPYPEWVMAGDSRPEEQLATRQKLLKQLADKKEALFCAHFPNPGFGYVREISADQYVYEPARWLFASDIRV